MEFIKALLRPPEMKMTLSAIDRVKGNFTGDIYTLGALDAACVAAKEKAGRQLPQIRQALTSQRWAVDDLAVYFIANVCNAALSCGRNHIYRGVLSGQGNGYLAVYSQAIARLIASGFMSEADAKNDMAALEQTIKEVG